MKDITLGPLKDFKDGDCRVFKQGELEFGVFRRGAKLIAWENRCPHQGGPVCQGKIFNRVEEVMDKHKATVDLTFAREEHIVCPWHGYEYNLQTGEHPGDASIRLNPVEVVVKNDEVRARIAERTPRKR